MPDSQMQQPTMVPSVSEGTPLVPIQDTPTPEAMPQQVQAPQTAGALATQNKNDINALIDSIMNDTFSDSPPPEDYGSGQPGEPTADEMRAFYNQHHTQAVPVATATSTTTQVQPTMAQAQAQYTEEQARAMQEFNAKLNSQPAQAGAPNIQAQVAFYERLHKEATNKVSAALESVGQTFNEYEPAHQTALQFEVQRLTQEVQAQYQQQQQTAQRAQHFDGMISNLLQHPQIQQIDQIAQHKIATMPTWQRDALVNNLKNKDPQTLQEFYGDVLGTLQSYNVPQAQSQVQFPGMGNRPRAPYVEPAGTANRTPMGGVGQSGQGTDYAAFSTMNAHQRAKALGQLF